MTNAQAIDFQIDHTKLYIAQVEDYLAKIGKPLEEYIQLPLEQAKQLTSFFVTELDFGAHGSNSDRHMAEIYLALSERIINSVCSAKEYLTEQGFEDIAQCNQKTLMSCFKHFFYKCPFCGTRFLTKYSKGKLAFLDEEKQLMFNKYIPPSKTECFCEDEVIQVRFKAKSDRMVFANDLRHFLKNQDIDFDDEQYDINMPFGRIKAVRHFAENNVLCVHTGNTLMSLFQHQDTLIITDAYHPDIEQYGYDESVKEQSRAINHKIQTEDYVPKGEISCGLWWLMGAPVDDVDMDRLQASDHESHFLIDIEKDAEYCLEFKSHTGYFKYYKFFKIS